MVKVLETNQKFLKKKKQQKERLENKKRKQNLSGRFRPRPVDKPKHDHRWGIVRSLRLFSISNISNTRDTVSSGCPNTEKRVENTTRSGVFLTKFEVFE